MEKYILIKKIHTNNKQIKNQRIDFLHKLFVAKQMVNTNQTVSDGPLLLTVLETCNNPLMGLSNMEQISEGWG